MKIYAIEKDLKHLLLMDGNWVVNGAYECTTNEDGSLGIPDGNLKAYYVMEAPKPKKEQSVYYYNTVLGVAEEILKEKGLLV